MLEQANYVIRDTSSNWNLSEKQMIAILFSKLYWSYTKEIKITMRLNK